MSVYYMADYRPRRRDDFDTFRGFFIGTILGLLFWIPIIWWLLA